MPVISDAGVQPCQRVRSTLLIGSLRALRAHGHADAYASKLAPEHFATLSALGAPCWLPLRIADAHYSACDSLGLSADEMLKIGATVAPTATSGVQVVLHTARTTGATPWAVLDRAPTYWNRMYDGSALVVLKTGPKDATISVRRNALSRSMYWRVGLRGIILQLARGLSSAAFVRETQHDAAHDAVTYGLAWA